MISLQRQLGCLLLKGNRGVSSNHILPAVSHFHLCGTKRGLSTDAAVPADEGVLKVDAEAKADVTAGGIESIKTHSAQTAATTVVIVGAARTPMGAFAGALSKIPCTQLGSIAIKGAIERANIRPEVVSEVIMGNVLQGGVGQAPARQAALGAGLPPGVVCTTINKMCASGMKAVMYGAQSIMLGHSQVVVAGGMENMSRAPFYVTRSLCASFGHQKLQDGLILDGLWDVYNDMHMGSCAELCASEMGISREEQDDYAIASYERALAAVESGRFKAEIVEVSVPAKKKGQQTLVSEDEACKKFNADKLRQLLPAFESDGTVTAGNASPISDGAAALVLTSEEYARKEGLPILAKIRGMADAEQKPERFPTTPSLAIPKAVDRAGLKLDDVDLFELNEAFAVVQIANERLLGLSPDYVNIHGGAVSLGHPIGASGARLLVSLVHSLAERKEKYGCASICNGGGGASAVVLELP